MLLARYLHRVRGPLSTSLIITIALVFGSPMSSLMIGYLGLCFLISTYLLSEIIEFFYDSDAHPARVAIFILSAITSIILLYFFPHVFLFFNALPSALSFPYVLLTTFLVNFDLFLLMNRMTSKFSIVKIFLNPKKGISRLEELLAPNIQRARRQLEQTTTTNFAVAENQKSNCSLSLIALKERQQQALARLPAEAKINDKMLYEKHLVKLIQEKKWHTQLSDYENLPNAKDLSALGKKKQDIAFQRMSEVQEALAEAKKEAQELAQAYANTLSTNEHQVLYFAYRELVMKLSATHGQCPVTCEDILSQKSANFLTLEKRYIVEKIEVAAGERRTVKKSYAIPEQTKTYYKSCLEQLFDNKVVRSVEVLAENPENRDNFLQPTPYKTYPTEYVYHTHEELEGHAICLELCEAIEFFLDPSLVTAKEEDAAPGKAIETQENEKKAAENAKKTVQESGQSNSSSSASPAPIRTQLQTSNRTDLLPARGIYSRGRRQSRQEIQEEVIRAALEAGINVNSLFR